MVKEKYFNHWAYAEGSHYNFKNIFITQESICQKHNNLEEWNVNPLTIRLCLLQESFGNLFNARLKIRQRTSNPGYEYHPNQTMHVSGVESSMIIVTNGYFGESFSLNLHEIYKNFYAFCSFFSAVLDRLAFEIHILYGIGDPNKIDWRQFKKKNGTNGVLLNDLSQKSRELANIISASNFSRLLDIRDGFEHGKKIEISANSPDANFDFTVKYENIENEIVDFSLTQIINLLRMCEGIYQKIS